MLGFIRKITPRILVRLYHYVMAVTGALWYGHPSRRMMVVGITGTSGKSTTVFLLDHILRYSGHKVGSTSTIGFRVGDDFSLNNKKMTQLGRWQTHKLMRRMADAGCDVAIIETTSQGIEQFRHLGIAYDVVLLTNLYPEHIDAHGGFESYKNAKKKLFYYCASRPPKPKFNIPTTVIVNGVAREAKEFLSASVERKWTYLAEVVGADKAFMPEDGQPGSDGGRYTVELVKFYVPLMGAHIIEDATAAVATANALGISLEITAEALRSVPPVPGRIEFIRAGQQFTIIVDFAFEPVAMQKLYDVVATIPHNRVIHVLGAAGGGRDIDRRIILGNMAGENAAEMIVTNEDPYDDDPKAIMEMVATGGRAVGKKDGVDLFIIDDRRAAIAHALRSARERDIILITGKGSEQAIVGPHGALKQWDDRVVVREELARL